MIREAGPEDQPAVEALLSRQIDGAMFPLANLRSHGLARGDFASDHEHAVRVWRLDDDSLVALTRGGMLLPLLSGRPDLSPLRPALHGLTVTGAVGPASSDRPLLSALGLDRQPTQVNRDEPGFSLDLSHLRTPDLPGAALKPATETLRTTLVAWRATYQGEVLGTSPDDAQKRAEADIDAYLARDSHRVLVLDGQPVAMTGFNAILPEIVQVGGVYTPPHLRGRGYARQAVALHLAEARTSGVARAVLFAANDAAARAYSAIGFQPSQPFALVLFHTAITMEPCP
jgi:RimJ/RimL family protein N-acetyltransferase